VARAGLCGLTDLEATPAAGSAYVKGLCRFLAVGTEAWVGG
jgi:hypothetical protein